MQTKITGGIVLLTFLFAPMASMSSINSSSIKNDSVKEIGINEKDNTRTTVYDPLVSSNLDKHTNTKWMSMLEKDKELMSLAICESKLDPLAINHEDSKINGDPSVSILQFSPTTFLEQVRYYKMLEDKTDDEIRKLAWVPELQIELAKKMLPDGKGGRWKTCYFKKFGSGSHRES